MSISKVYILFEFISYNHDAKKLKNYVPESLVNKSKSRFRFDV